MARTNGSYNGVDSRGEPLFRQMSGCLGQEVGGIRAIDLEIQAKLHFLSGAHSAARSTRKLAARRERRIKNDTKPVLFTQAIAPLDYIVCLGFREPCLRPEDQQACLSGSGRPG